MKGPSSRGPSAFRRTAVEPQGMPEQALPIERTPAPGGEMMAFPKVPGELDLPGLVRVLLWQRHRDQERRQPKSERRPRPRRPETGVERIEPRHLAPEICSKSGPPWWVTPPKFEPSAEEDRDLRWYFAQGPKPRLTEKQRLRWKRIDRALRGRGRRLCLYYTNPQKLSDPRLAAILHDADALSALAEGKRRGFACDVCWPTAAEEKRARDAYNAELRARRAEVDRERRYRRRPAAGTPSAEWSLEYFLATQSPHPPAKPCRCIAWQTPPDIKALDRKLGTETRPERFVLGALRVHAVNALRTEYDRFRFIRGQKKHEGRPSKQRLARVEAYVVLPFPTLLRAIAQGRHSLPVDLAEPAKIVPNVWEQRRSWRTGERRWKQKDLEWKHPEDFAANLFRAGLLENSTWGDVRISLDNARMLASQWFLGERPLDIDRMSPEQLRELFARYAKKPVPPREKQTPDGRWCMCPRKTGENLTGTWQCETMMFVRADAETVRCPGCGHRHTANKLALQETKRLLGRASWSDRVMERPCTSSGPGVTVDQFASLFKQPSSEIRASLIQHGCEAARQPRQPVPPDWLDSDQGRAWSNEWDKRLRARSAAVAPRKTIGPTVSELARKFRPLLGKEIQASLIRAGCAAAKNRRQRIPDDWFQTERGREWQENMTRLADVAGATLGGKFSGRFGTTRSR